jgi:hypothetical protein
LIVVAVAWAVLVGEALYMDSLRVSVSGVGGDVVVVVPLAMLDGEVTEEEGGDIGMELGPVTTPPLVVAELTREYEIGVVVVVEDGKDAADVTPVTQ